MGTCKAKCQTLSLKISADATISMVNSDLMLLFNDYRCRDVLNRELFESENITYLATALEFSHDQILCLCSDHISLKTFTGANTYEEAITELTHFENSIRTIRMNMNLTSSLSNQHLLINDHKLASSLIHDQHLNLIQNNRKRSRIFNLRNYPLCKREDISPTPRMNQYGYDGPNRHQFGENKIPIPDRYLNPQPDRFFNPQSPPLSVRYTNSNNPHHQQYNNNPSYCQQNRNNNDNTRHPTSNSSSHSEEDDNTDDTID